MEGIVDFLEEEAVFLEQVYPGTLVMDGESYAVARGGEEWELERQRGGYEDESEARVRVRKSLVPVRPVKRKAVTLDGRPYVVDDVQERTGGVVWVLSLKRK